MNKLLPIAVFLVAIGFGTVISFDGKSDPHATHAAANLDPTCPERNVVPVGALPGQPAPIWCYTNLENGAGTAVKSANGWVDDFNHGLTLGDCCHDYLIYTKGSYHRIQHWRHADHWMVDLDGLSNDACSGQTCGPWDVGGAAMRPDRSFNFVDLGDGRGKTLIVETDIAVGIDAYAGEAWSELTISTGDHFTGERPTSNGLYIYDQFINEYVVGCRLQADWTVTCAFFRNDTRGPGQGGRIWEISHFQNETNSTFRCGGFPGTTPCVTPLPVRFCHGSDPDTNCRDRVRWEMSKAEIRLYVNNVLYFRQAGFSPDKQLDDAFINAPVYTYFGEVEQKLGTIARFHWDRVAINPGGATSTPTPSLPTSTPTAPPLPSPTPSATAVATSTPSATSTIAPQPSATPTPTATATVPVPTIAPTATATPSLPLKTCRVQERAGNRWVTVRTYQAAVC